MPSSTLNLVKALVESEDIKISEHGFDELIADDISVRDVVNGVIDALELEDYPGFGKGPSVLVLQRDREANPIHVVWGIPKGFESPAVLVTAYRPDPGKWDEDFMRRKA